MNNLSKFMTRQQNLKSLTIQHIAETLNYTTEAEGKSSRYVIKKCDPSKLPDKALSDFFNSLSRCASSSLQILILYNFQIDT